MKRSIVIDAIAFLLILLFVYTALSKLVTFESFRLVLYKSPALQLFAPVLAWALPVVEIIVALLLVIPSLRLFGFWCSAFLMLLFTIYIAYMLIFTPNRPCNCGGVLRTMSWNQHLIFNIFFTLLSIWGINLQNKARPTTFLVTA